MKKSVLLLFALALVLALASCGVSAVGGTSEPAGVPDGSGSAGLADASQPEEDHDHQLVQGDNIVPHDDVGYCGNTVTEVTLDGETYSFWGEDSVALTDIVINLAYTEEVCRCLPEFTVDTEFGDGYGVNLTESYVRCEAGQAPLTAEQTEEIRGIIERNCK